MRARAKKSQAKEWTELLMSAIRSPGVISAAYQQFWNYSIGNQLLAIFECVGRGIEPGPIHTYVGWQALGRQVKKGEKAITLCMPVTVKRKMRRAPSRHASPPSSSPNQEDPESESVTKGKSERKTIFLYKARWFVLSQTEGKPYVPVELPQWSEAKALHALKIERVSFDHTNGNCQGFARQRQVAVSPIAELPWRTLLHELAHVVLGHTQETSMEDDERTPGSLREVEAEGVSLICSEALGLKGSAESRGYLQHWLRGEVIPEISVQKILKTADMLLKAGYPDAPTDSV